jgi:hypothetical protein
VRFVADEGVDRQYVAEMSPGMLDETVLMQSRSSASVLITVHKDFGELVFRQRQASTGVLLIRLWGLGPAMKAAVVSEAILEHGQELVGAFAVLSPGNIRIRRDAGHRGI